MMSMTRTVGSECRVFGINSVLCSEFALGRAPGPGPKGLRAWTSLSGPGQPENSDLGRDGMLEALSTSSELAR